MIQQIERAQSYIGKTLERISDKWFQDLLASGGVQFEAGEYGWGVAAVAAICPCGEKINYPVAGCVVIYKEDVYAWAGIVTEIEGDNFRAIEFGTRTGYSQHQHGWQVLPKYRTMDRYDVQFFSGVLSLDNEDELTEINNPAIPQVEYSLAEVDFDEPEENITFKLDHFETKTDTPPSDNDAEQII